MSRRPIIRLLSARLARPARHYHEMPVLEQEQQFRDGIPGFLTRGAFEMAWRHKQMDLLSRLNEKLAGTTLEEDPLKTLIIKVARDPDQTPIFNLASLAFNNKFFFDGLTTDEVPMDSTLIQKIEHSFSSVDTFRQTFLDTALSMFGPGFVWLVKADASRLMIMNTYLAGTPFSRAHWKNQMVDATSIPATSSTVSDFFMKNSRAQAGGMGLGVGRNGAPGGVDVEPILCLNTWEYVWLRDYGVGMAGKEDYVNNWWTRVNWNTVSAAARPRSRFDV